MKRFSFYLQVLMISAAEILTSCGTDSSTTVGVRTGCLEAGSWDVSSWISAVDAPIMTDITNNGDVPECRSADGASWFVLENSNKAKVVSAKWMTAGLGVYTLYLNGRKVGDDFLKPGFTHPQKTKYSFTYDISKAFAKGNGEKNVLSAQVTPGWWADKIMTPGGQKGMNGTKCAFRAVLELVYADGSRELIGTDTEQWKAGVAGPVTHAAIFDGEEYDARELPGYERVADFKAPEINAEFSGEILPSQGAEISLRKDLELSPVRMYVWEEVEGRKEGEYGKVVIKREYKKGQTIDLAPGETLEVDFGQNASAVPSFVFKAAAGTKLVCLPCELLNDGNGAKSRGMDGPEGSGHRANLRTPVNAMRLYYTFAGEEDYVAYHPECTFFGYRFVTITTDGPVQIKSITSIPVTSIKKEMEIGTITTGDDLVNRLISNTVWGQRSNYLSVPTDCPQRNERLGWTADTQVFTETGTFFANTDRFFHKWTRDLRDSQSPLGGFPGVAPKAQYGSEMMRLGWADAGIIVPWTVWKQFGDKSIVDENWEAMEHFMSHVNETKYDHEALIAENGNYQWADWLSYEPLESCGGRSHYSDASGRWTLRPETIVYWKYLSASYWAIDAGMMRDMAVNTGRDASKYEAMQQEARAYLKETFLNEDGTFKTPILNTMQTPALFALKNDLVQGQAREAMLERLRQNFLDHDGCLQTGFLGTSILMGTLTENGMTDVAYDLLFQRKNPSWLYSIDNGATTIWERWNSYTLESGMGPQGMNSFNHYAYGAVCQWIWQTVAGIATSTEEPGFQTVILKPVPDRRLGFVKAEYNSASGLIKSHWRYDGDKWIWEFTIPSRALVTLPGQEEQKEYAPGNYKIVLDLPSDEKPSLLEAFANPPKEARARVWWHWMDGNISKEGIKKDLDWMAVSGIAGFQQFDAGGTMGGKTIVEHVPYMSDSWKDAFRYAIGYADSLGMEVAIASAPGWSSTGGPWVKPENAMKKLSWSTLEVKGEGVEKTISLPQPYTQVGKYQNTELEKNGEPWYRDVAVVAVRIPQEDKSLADLGAELSCSGGEFSLEALTNGDLSDGGILIPEESTGKRWLQYSFPEPVTIKALSVCGLPTRSIWGMRDANYDNALLCSDDGNSWEEICRVPTGILLTQTIDVPDTKARYFRFAVNYPRADKELRINEFNLFTVSKINHSEEKAGFAAPYDFAAFITPEATAPATETIDLTTFAKDGNLTWSVPEGRWRIYRFGATLTGKKNHPASPEATGLEVDKLDREAWKDYFHQYLGMYKEASGGLLGQRGISYLLIDSYEAGQMTWTPTLRETFKKEHCYDLIPWLPVLTGEIVQSTARSEQFLFDWRATIGSMLAANYDYLTEILKEYKLKGRYIEAQENGRVFIGDGMDLKKGSTVPMAAIWVNGTTHEMSSADIRESASVAHIYGQNLVAVESFTVSGRSENAWNYYPGNIRHTAHVALSNGANRFIIHESSHQPSDAHKPGLDLLGYGQWFNRHDTWAPYAKYWIDYLSRSCFLMQQGRFVADVLWYYGEDINITGIYGRHLPDVPQGYNFDFIQPSGLMELVSVADGDLVVPSGMRYKVLALGRNCESMSLPVLRKLVELAGEGAVICGTLPKRPAGIEDDTQEFTVLVEKLSALVSKKQLKEILSETIGPDYTGPSDIKYLHRDCGDRQIYWVCNFSDKEISSNVGFRDAAGPCTVLDPETGRPDAGAYKNGVLTLAPEKALFLVFDKDGVAQPEVPGPRRGRAFNISGPWKVDFDGLGAPEGTRLMDKLASLTLSEDKDVKYFSGTATYTTDFTIEKEDNPRGLQIDLGEVGQMADVYVNGTHVAFLWHAPYMVDWEGYVKIGRNTLTVKVVNTWSNKLIGDSGLAEQDRLTYTAREFYKPTSRLTPSGLMGPVKITVLE